MPAPAETEPPSADLIELIRWYTDMGVDLALDETPHDRFAEAAAEVRVVAPGSVPTSSRRSPHRRRSSARPSRP